MARWLASYLSCVYVFLKTALLTFSEMAQQQMDFHCKIMYVSLVDMEGYSVNCK